MTKDPRPTTSAGLLVLRLAVGGIFAAHGAQKTFEYTFAGTADAFAAMGAPLAELTGPLVALLELLGGFAVILGVLTRPIAVLLAVDMLVAVILVHAQQGLWVTEGGYEFVALLGAGALALAFTGAGRMSVDALAMRGRLRALA